MKNQKKIIISSVLLLLLIMVTIGVTFAAFTYSKKGTVENTIETGTVTLTYTEGKTGILLNEAYPMSDEKGKVLTGEDNVFDFTVQANLSRTMSIGYEVTAVKIPITDMTPLEDDEVKLYLERAIDPDTNYSEVFAPSHYLPRDNQTEIGSPIGSMILDTGTFTESGTTIHNYRLRMWVDENTSIPSGESRKYGVRINVYAKQDIIATPVEDPLLKNFTFDKTTGTITGYSDTALKDVVIPDKIGGVAVTSIGDFAFANQNLTSITIPSTVTSIGKGAFNNNQVSDSEGFIYKRNADGSIDNSTIVSYAGAKKDNVVIPNGVTTIGDSAFQSVGLNSVTFPESLTSIGVSSFQSNNLTTVTLPKNVKTIGTNAFADNPLIEISNQTGKDFTWSTITGKDNVTVTVPLKEPNNKNITAIYQYDQTKDSSTFCVTGEESTCVQIGDPGTYETGTIIKYKVNDTTEKYFHVMFDNGDTLTLQQRENTGYKKPWHKTNTNKNGPTAALSSLENATKGWTNVLDQTYTPGTTVFKDNFYTGCSYNSCTTNTYTLGQRTAKARLITVHGEVSSCPVWMINYLQLSIRSGGTVNRTDNGGGSYGTNKGYWTMNASASDPKSAGCIGHNGNMGFPSTGGEYSSYGVVTNIAYGVRAVVVIQK